MDREILFVSVQLTTSRIGNLLRVTYIIQTCLSLAAVDVLQGIGNTPPLFLEVQKSVQNSELAVFFKTQQKVAVFVEHVSAIISAQHLVACFPASLLFLPCPGVRVGQNEVRRIPERAPMLWCC